MMQNVCINICKHIIIWKGTTYMLNKTADVYNHALDICSKVCI